MDDKDKLIDQSPLAEDVAKSIKYDFLDYFLVKPLDPVKIKKEFSKPVSNGKATKDAEGIEAVDFDEVETEVKEVNSDYLIIAEASFLNDHSITTVAMLLAQVLRLKSETLYYLEIPQDFSSIYLRIADCFVYTTFSDSKHDRS